MDELERPVTFIAHNRALLPREYQRVYLYVADWNRVVGLWWAYDREGCAWLDARTEIGVCVRKASDVETASLDVWRLGSSQPMVQSHPTARVAKAYRRDECQKRWSNTHDASASAEVVVGPKICLYWNRDGSPAWPVDVPPELLPALGTWVFACGSDDMGGLLISGGRVVDPVSGMDAIGDVVVLDGQIAAVGTGLGSAERVIDATGLVVAPGFIDLHAHGQLIPADRMQAFDGVTTTLDLEAGVLPVASWYRRQAAQGRVLNYGAAANWAFARIGAMTGSNAEWKPSAMPCAIAAGSRTWPAIRRWPASSTALQTD
jgi:Amidohydrolase family